MAQTFYTSDWHLGSGIVLKSCSRPFKNPESMNSALILNCNNVASEKSDCVIHVGDFAIYKKDRDDYGLSLNPMLMTKILKSTFVLLEGNHDSNNKVRTIGKYLRTTLGPFTDVSVSHYPSYDKKAEGTFLKGDIHLCGHVHGKWKYFIDKENQVFNVNVGVDVWDYKPVSEDVLISFIRETMVKISTKS